MKSIKVILATTICTLVGSQAQAYYGVYSISSNGVFGYSSSERTLDEAVTKAIAACKSNNGWKCQVPSTAQGNYLYTTPGGYMSVARSDTSNRGTQVMAVGYSFAPQEAREIAFANCKQKAGSMVHWVSKGQTRTEPLANTCRVIYHRKQN